MKQLVSRATIANWQRLGNLHKQLLHRANKTDSKRLIFPEKYVENEQSKKNILNLAAFVGDNSLKTDEFILTLAGSVINKVATISNTNKKRYLNSIQSQLGYAPTSFEVDSDLIKSILMEPDFFGGLFQTLKTEGTRNKNGLYYTPYYVADDLLMKIKFDQQQYFFDPGVGTGIFLVELLLKFNIPVAKLHGSDIDPIAALLATANLLLHAPAFDNTYPDIQIKDYLQTKTSVKYSCIVGNPPWGAKNISAVNSSHFPKADSFAYFLEKGLRELTTCGKLAFVLPVAFLNIATHQPVRNLILQDCSLESVTYLPNLFQGVISDVVLVIIKKNRAPHNLVTFYKKGQIIETPQESYLHVPNENLLPLKNIDLEIMHTIWQRKTVDLANSAWGLGIVTGNNKKHVLDAPTEQTEPIITGKEVQPYVLKEARHFLNFQREKFQQAAKNEIYRTPEKLVYKFINKRLAFAYDDQQLLTLNSANILVPHVLTHSVKTVMALLNSQLFQYLYAILFDSPKILRGNLQALPLIKLSKQESKFLEGLVEQQLTQQNKLAQIDDFVFTKYALNHRQISRIHQVLTKGIFA